MTFKADTTWSFDIRRQTKEAAPIASNGDAAPHHTSSGRAACDGRVSRKSSYGFATMEKFFRSAI
jgi:hypothetical protein